MADLVPPRAGLEQLDVYDPGRYRVAVNLSANENPYDLPAEIKSQVVALSKRLSFNRYPDPLALELREAIAGANGVKVGNVAVGNGADELILGLLLAYGGPRRRAVTFEPSFAMYSILAELTNTACVRLNRDRFFSLPAAAARLAGEAEANVIFVCCPNNPTGNLVEEQQIGDLAAGGKALLVVDEAYHEFSDFSALHMLGCYPNLVILRTFSKAFSLAGLRVGYMLAGEDIIRNLQKVKLPYNVNAFSQAVATLLLEKRRHFEGTISKIVAERDRVYGELKGSGTVHPFPSAANFLLVRTGRSASKVWRALLEKGILVRDLGAVPALKNCLRVTIGTPQQNSLLLSVLANLNSEGA